MGSTTTRTTLSHPFVLSHVFAIQKKFIAKVYEHREHRENFRILPFFRMFSQFTSSPQPKCALGLRASRFRARHRLRLVGLVVTIEVSGLHKV
jgi:hypothetical protein